MAVHPHIGIALAVYRPTEHYLRLQLESLIKQTHSNWSCQISCDSPLDEIRAMRSLAPYFVDARFNWRENSKRLGHSRNFWSAALSCAQDQSVSTIAFCDQDDIWMPEKLEACWKALKTKPKLSLVYSDLTPFSTSPLDLGSQSLAQLERRKLESGSSSELAHRLMVRSVVNGNTALFDANLCRQFPMLPNFVRQHDQWVSILAALNGGLYPLEESLVWYRLHRGNVSGANLFHGILHIPRAPISRIKKSALDLELLNQSILEAGLPILPLKTQNLFLIALKNFLHDPVLFRACTSRILGRTVLRAK